MSPTSSAEQDSALLHNLVVPVLEDHSTLDDVRRAEDEGGFAPALWRAFADTGLLWVSVPEESGGSGGSLHDAFALLRLLGRYAAPVPFAETGVLAGWLFAAGQLPVPKVPATAAVAAGRVAVTRSGGAAILTGALDRVPYARHCGRLALLLDDGAVSSIDLGQAEVTPGTNLAGEPRDTVMLAGLRVEDDATGRPAADVDAEMFLLRAKLSRVLAMTGAMERVLELTTRYVNERQQFGRPIGRFQSVQAHVVRVAEETACARMSAEVAARAFADGDPGASAWVAMAAVAAADAARVVTAGAHQVHGAMGMTREYPLALFTRRLWAWRGEHGSERYWRRRVGEQVASAGADRLWPLLTTGLVQS